MKLSYRFPGLGAEIHHRFGTRAGTPLPPSTSSLSNGVSATSTPFTAQVCGTDASGFPTSVCTDLTVSVPYDAGTLSLPAPASTTLTQGTTYAVVVRGANRKLEPTALRLASQYRGNAAGWSIENRFDFLQHFHQRMWKQVSSSVRSLRIAIKGTAVGSGTTATLSVGDASGDRGRHHDLPGHAVGSGHGRGDGDLDGVVREQRGERGGGGSRVVDDGDADHRGRRHGGNVHGDDGAGHHGRA